MTYLLSHIWLPYVLALVLMIAGFFFKLGSADTFLYTVVLNLVPELGLWCIRCGHIIPAVVIAVICCGVLLLAAWGFIQALTSFDKKLTISGILLGLTAVILAVFCGFSADGQILQTVVVVCCLYGMLSLIYVLWWFSELGTGMSST